MKDIVTVKITIACWDDWEWDGRTSVSEILTDVDQNNPNSVNKAKEMVIRDAKVWCPDREFYDVEKVEVLP